MISFPQSKTPIRFTDAVQTLNPAFIENIKLLKERIYSKALNKYFDGISLSPNMMINLIDCLVRLYNKKSTIIYPNYRTILPQLGMLCDPNIGNLIIEFEIEFPSLLSKEQIQSLENIL